MSSSARTPEMLVSSCAIHGKINVDTDSKEATCSWVS